MSPQTSPYGLKLQPLPSSSEGIDGLLCVDMEDWHQIVQQQLGASPRHCAVPFRRGLDALLSLLDQHNQKATFFVLGMTAAGSREVIRELSDLGHEIATHGFDHIHLERRTTDQFREDLKRALGQLGELTGDPVLGHRAPEFSIPRDRVGPFFEVLAELGLRYDSSVYPIQGERYGLAGFPRRPQRVETAYGEVIELPLATAELAGRRIPIGGGGMWRLLPGRVLRPLAQRARDEGVLLTTYVHNYEFDPDRLILSEVIPRSGLERSPLRTELSGNLFRARLSGRLERMLERFRFSTCRDYLQSIQSLDG